MKISLSPFSIFKTLPFRGVDSNWGATSSFLSNDSTSVFSVSVESFSSVIEVVSTGSIFGISITEIGAACRAIASKF